MVGRYLRQQRLAHFKALRQAIFPAFSDRMPLHQLAGIIDELLDHVAGENAGLPAHFFGRAGDDQHRQVVDVLQLPSAGSPFNEGAALLSPGGRSRQ